MAAAGDASNRSNGDVAAALAQLLDLAGVERLYGAAHPAWAAAPRWEAPAALAPVLAVAHHWVHGRPAGVAGGDGRLRLGAIDGEATIELRIAGPDDVASAADVLLATLVSDAGASVDLVVAADPAAPAPPLTLVAPAPADRWQPPSDEVVDQVQRAARPMVVAGPGVVSAGAVAGLAALAAAADLGVLNTWGAKGVFDWRSRHHWATVGLQSDDLRLGGVAEADLVVVTGADPDELDQDELRRLTDATGAALVTVEPDGLAPLAERWRRGAGGLDTPPLRLGLAEVTQRGWAAAGPPLAPSQVTRHYAEVLAGRGFVAAAPGRAGYWVARTFATTFLGAARVPARRRPVGLAVACALVGGRRRPGPGRPLAVVDAPLGPIDSELLELAQARGVPIVVEQWDPDGPALDAEQHRRRLADALSRPGPAVLALATDRRQLDDMIDVAGPVTAWGGLTTEESR